MALKKDGSVWTTGRNRGSPIYGTKPGGQLGDGTKSERLSFVKVVPSGVTAIAAGDYHSMVLTHDGSVWTTGENADGELGDGTKTERLSFVKAKCPGCVTTSAELWVAVRSQGLALGLGVGFKVCDRVSSRILGGRNVRTA